MLNDLFDAYLSPKDKLKLAEDIIKNPSLFKEEYKDCDIYDFVYDISEACATSNYNPFDTVPFVYKNCENKKLRDHLLEAAKNDMIVYSVNNSLYSQLDELENIDKDSNFYTYIREFYKVNINDLDNSNVSLYTDYVSRFDYKDREEAHHAFVDEDIHNLTRKMKTRGKDNFVAYTLATRRCPRAERVFDILMNEAYEKNIVKMFEKCYGDIDLLQDFENLKDKGNTFKEVTLDKLIKDKDKRLQRNEKRLDFFIDKSIMPSYYKGEGKLGIIDSMMPSFSLIKDKDYKKKVIHGQRTSNREIQAIDSTGEKSKLEEDIKKHREMLKREKQREEGTFELDIQPVKLVGENRFSL